MVTLNVIAWPTSEIRRARDTDRGGVRADVLEHELGRREEARIARGVGVDLVQAEREAVSLRERGALRDAACQRDSRTGGKPSIANCTVPVGVPGLPVTVAVKVTPWPATDGFWELTMVTVLSFVGAEKAAVVPVVVATVAPTTVITVHHAR